MTTGPGRKTRPIWCSSCLHRQLHTPEVKPRPLPLPAKGVKQVRSFMREKKIYCGKHCREVDIYPYHRGATDSIYAREEVKENQGNGAEAKEPE